MKDFYAILEVSPTAGAAEVKRAFRKLAVRYHPDKNRSAEAKSLFQEISEAYDTLGDAEKRAAYDLRRARPVTEIISEPIRTHRDPAYHGRGAYAPPRKKEPPASYLLMLELLKYAVWVSRVGLLASTLFFIDYFLPYHQHDERIQRIETVRYGRNAVYHVVVTESGRKIKLYDFEAVNFRNEAAIRIFRTTLYKTIMSVSTLSENYRVRVAYLYGTLLFMPIILFVNSLLAILFRKRAEWSFNLNVTCFVWLVMNFILL